LEIIDVGCNLKQFDGLTCWLDLSDPDHTILWQIYATASCYLLIAPLRKNASKLDNFLSYHANRQTDRQTDRQRLVKHTLRWPWVTPKPGFKVTVYLQVQYLKVTQDVRAERLKWFSTIFQDILWRVFYDFPRPYTACRSTSFYNTVNATFTARCYRTLYKFLCHDASDVPAVANTNVFINSTKYRMW